MTVGNFNEVIGSDGFDSIRAEEDISVVYGVDDGDNLTSSLNDDDPTSIVVGGAGDNNYVIFPDATTFILENSDGDNTLFTGIGSSSGISLEDDNSFVAEIDGRHLYLGNTATERYVVIFDWQLPENQIETFSLSGGALSYDEFVTSFRESDNYRGDFTWAELAETDEVAPIDLEDLGLAAATLDEDLETIERRSQDLSFITSNPLGTFIDNAVANVENEEDFLESFVFGDLDDDVLRGTTANEALLGDRGDDRITGNFGDDIIAGGLVGADVGGSDTLLGGYGNDAYYVSLSAGGGTIVQDEIDPDDTDVLFILAEDTDLDSLFDNEEADSEESSNIFAPDEYLESITDSTTYGDAAISIAEPEEGIVGIEKSGTDLIIDLNRDGIADADDDLSIIDFFAEDGQLGNGSMAQINNILDPQAIADFF
ncbi:MAG: hypothetical protein AAFQ41_16405 [Cyanobacteria bacterium J06623_7]